jgi:rod shape-determining protein MreC
VPQFFMNKRLLTLLVGIILLVALIGFSMRERESLTWPEELIKDTTGFLQNIFAKPAQSIAGFVENIQDLLDTYEENEILKKRLDEYAQLRVEADRLREENEELKGLLQIEKDLASYNPRKASVIARSADGWKETLVIDKGEIHGIEKNMAVVAAGGMIGKIETVSKITSTVQLLTAQDPTNRIHAAILGGNETVYGLIDGYDEETGRLLLTEIQSGKEVKEGAEVITSGLGGVYPEGIFIGTVDKVEADRFGLTKTAYVKPAADFNHIKHVLVIERLMTKPTDEGDAAAK